MATENPVFQVLVTNGNKALLAKDKTLSDLTPGQLGIFNADTNISVDNTNISTVRDFYLALGIDRDGDDTVDDILKSSGQIIQKRNITGMNLDCPVAPLPKIVDITDFKGMCETEYAIRVTLRNQETYLTNGFTPDSKTYTIMTSCCDKEDCFSCPKGDCNEVAVKMVESINSDPDNLLKAYLIDGDEEILDLEDLEDWLDDEANEDICLGIRIEANIAAITKFCSINHKYFKPRNTDIEVSLVKGFDCNGTVTVVQDGRIEKGSGYDIAQLEYEAGGWNGKPGPYRQSAITGLATTSFESYVNQTARYAQFNLIYDQESVGGWLEYKNNLNTIVAVPSTDTTTINSLIATLNAANTGLPTLVAC